MTKYSSRTLPLLAGIACLALASPSMAKSPKVVDEKTSDLGMSCDQIAHEVVALDKVIVDSRETQKKSRNADTGVTVAQTVGSVLIGSLGGVLGLAAAGVLASEAAEDAGEDAAALEEKAEERQNRLAGLFDGKGCEGELALTRDQEDDTPSDVEPAAGETTAQNVAVKTPRRPRYND
jgi:hypothetical protein